MSPTNRKEPGPLKVLIHKMPQYTSAVPETFSPAISIAYDSEYFSYRIYDLRLDSTCTDTRSRGIHSSRTTLATDVLEPLNALHISWSFDVIISLSFIMLEDLASGSL